MKRLINKKNYKWRDYIAYKKLKLSLPKSLRHFAQLYPTMKFKRNGDRTFSVFHNEKFICKSQPWEKLKQLLSDKDIFQIGGGPSINNQDLTKIKKENVIFVNATISIASKIQFEGNIIYAIMDQYVIKHYYDIVKSALKSKTHCALSPECIRLICDRDPSLLSHGNIYIIESIYNGFNIALSPDEFLEYAKMNKDYVYVSGETLQDGTGRVIGFSLDPHLGNFGVATVMYCALQLAFYFSPKNIYLLGFDVQPSKTEDHFHKTDKDESRYNVLDYYFEEVVPAFTLASSIAKDKNINILNLSPVSKLPDEIIQHAKFESII